MNSNLKEIIQGILGYIDLKDKYKDYHKENLNDVFFIFANEVYELNDIVSAMDYKIDSLIEENNLPNKFTKNIILDYEEHLLNEIADVIFTTARLIKEFKLEEPLLEMMEYKYHRQLVREEKKKNERFI